MTADDHIVLIVDGDAAELGISEVTLESHGRNAMHKMAVHSLADLMRITERSEIPISHSHCAGGYRA